MSLKTEAENIVAHLKLLDYLQQFGKVGIAGSVALDLIVKPDIDVHVLAKNNDLFQIVEPVYRYLLDFPEIKKVNICDYRDRNGIKIGVGEYRGATCSWSIDIWLTTNEKTTGFELMERLNRDLTASQRELILKIKKDYYDRDACFESLSTAIYRAVVDHGIKSVSEFKKMDIHLLL